MHAFVLHIPSDKLDWARAEALKTGGNLMGDALSTSMVLIANELPESLRSFTPDHKPKSAKEKPVNSRVFVLDVPFEDRALASQLGARWDKTSKCWTYQGPHLPERLLPFAALPWSWEDAVEKAKLGIAPTPWAGEDPLAPRPHQIEAEHAILHACRHDYPGFLLADEVGLGKTLSAWMGVQSVAKQIQAKRVLIVCPLSVQAHWRETLRRQGSDIGEVLILNYERMSKLFEVPEGVKVKSKKGVAKRASAAEVDIIIFDESHKLKNPESARSKLARKLTAASKFTLWLSATAGQTPLELSYLAPLIAKSTGAKARDLNDFEGWCQDQGFKLKRGAFGAWIWDGDIVDCRKLATLLFEGKVPMALRRRPQEIAGWPEISRSLWPQELDAKQQQLYQEEWLLFKEALRQGYVKKAKVAGSKKKGISALVETLRFRQKSSLIRIPQTYAFGMELLENGIKPAISCSFKDSMTALQTLFEQKKLRVARIDGSQSAAERERERLRFQKGDADVMLFTIEEGISLHQGEYENVPRSLLIHDLRWSAIQMVQIEGRTHRNGQFAQAYWMMGENTIECKIAERVAKRAVSMKALSGEVDESLDVDILGELLQYLTVD